MPPVYTDRVYNQIQPEDSSEAPEEPQNPAGAPAGQITLEGSQQPSIERSNAEGRSDPDGTTGTQPEGHLKQGSQEQGKQRISVQTVELEGPPEQERISEGSQDGGILKGLIAAATRGIIRGANKELPAATELGVEVLTEKAITAVSKLGKMLQKETLHGQERSLLSHPKLREPFPTVDADAEEIMEPGEPTEVKRQLKLYRPLGETLNPEEPPQKFKKTKGQQEQERRQKRTLKHTPDPASQLKEPHIEHKTNGVLGGQQKPEEPSESSKDPEEPSKRSKNPDEPPKSSQDPEEPSKWSKNPEEQPESLKEPDGKQEPEIPEEKTKGQPAAELKRPHTIPEKRGKPDDSFKIGPKGPKRPQAGSPTHNNQPDSKEPKEPQTGTEKRSIVDRIVDAAADGLVSGTKEVFSEGAKLAGKTVSKIGSTILDGTNATTSILSKIGEKSTKNAEAPNQTGSQKRHPKPKESSELAEGQVERTAEQKHLPEGEMQTETSGPLEESQKSEETYIRPKSSKSARELGRIHEETTEPKKQAAESLEPQTGSKKKGLTDSLLDIGHEGIISSGKEAMKSCTKVTGKAIEKLGNSALANPETKLEKEEDKKAIATEPDEEEKPEMYGPLDGPQKQEEILEKLKYQESQHEQETLQEGIPEPKCLTEAAAESKRSQTGSSKRGFLERPPKPEEQTERSKTPEGPQEPENPLEKKIETEKEPEPLTESKEPTTEPKKLGLKGSFVELGKEGLFSVGKQVMDSTAKVAGQAVENVGKSAFARFKKKEDKEVITSKPVASRKRQQLPKQQSEPVIQSVENLEHEKPLEAYGPLEGPQRPDETLENPTEQEGQQKPPAAASTMTKLENKPVEKTTAPETQCQPKLVQKQEKSLELAKQPEPAVVMEQAENPGVPQDSVSIGVQERPISPARQQEEPHAPYNTTHPPNSKYPPRGHPEQNNCENSFILFGIVLFHLFLCFRHLNYSCSK